MKITSADQPPPRFSSPQTVEYSLRAIVWLASHPHDPQTNQQIANATLVHAGYLSKVKPSLGRGGLVTTQRGKRGGFLLAKHPPAHSACWK